MGENRRTGGRRSGIERCAVREPATTFACCCRGTRISPRRAAARHTRRRPRRARSGSARSSPSSKAEHAGHARRRPPARLPARARRAHGRRRLYGRRARRGPVPAPLRRRRRVERGRRLAPRRAPLPRLAYGARARAAAPRAAQLGAERADAAQRRLPGRVRRRDPRASRASRRSSKCCRPTRAAGGGTNFLRAGLRAADRVTTVSPTYAEEIRRPEFGMGLEDVLARARRRPGRHPERRRLWRLVAGPRPVPARSITTRRTSRRNAASRAGYSSGCGSGRTLDAPLIGVVSRLVEQKGIDLLDAGAAGAAVETRARASRCSATATRRSRRRCAAVADSHPRARVVHRRL